MTLLSKQMVRVNSKLLVTGTSHTLANDGYAFIDFDNSSAITLTIPTDSVNLPVNTIIYVTQLGTGTITISPSSGVKINYQLSNGNVSLGRYSVIVLEKLGSNFWNISGDCRFPILFESDLGAYWDAQDIKTTYSSWPARASNDMPIQNSILHGGSIGSLNSNWNSSGRTVVYNCTKFSNERSFSQISTDSGFTFFMVGQLRITGGDSWLMISTGSPINIPIIQNSSGICVARDSGDTRTVISTATITGAGFTDNQPVVICMAQDTASGSRLDRGLLYGNGTSLTGSSSTTNNASYANVTLADNVRFNASFGVYRRALSNAEMLQLAQQLAPRWGI